MPPLTAGDTPVHASFGLSVALSDNPPPRTAAPPTAPYPESTPEVRLRRSRYWSLLDNAEPGTVRRGCVRPTRRGARGPWIPEWTCPFPSGSND